MKTSEEKAERGVITDKTYENEQGKGRERSHHGQNPGKEPGKVREELSRTKPMKTGKEMSVRNQKL